MTPEKNYQNSKYTSKQNFSNSNDKSRRWKDQVLTFRQGINEGTYSVCIICNRCLYRRSVINFENKTYEVDSCIYIYDESFDCDHYIFKTYIYTE